MAVLLGLALFSANAVFAQSDTVEYQYAEGAVPLNAEDGSPIGAAYYPNSMEPMTYAVPYQGHVLVALGNGTVNGQNFSAAADEINLVYFLCEEENGCEITVDGKEGNVAVTVIFPGKEAPRTTATGALARSWGSPNCGGNGCNFATFTDMNSGDSQNYDRPAPDAQPATINPTAINPTVIAIVNGETSGMVLPGEVGHISRPSTSDGQMFFSAAEGGNTFVICEQGCQVEDQQVTAEQVVWVLGNKSDERTPADLNWTFEISNANVEDVAVLMLYGQDEDPQPYLQLMAERLLGQGVTDFDVVEVKYEPAISGFAMAVRTAEDMLDEFFGGPAPTAPAPTATAPAPTATAPAPTATAPAPTATAPAGTTPTDEAAAAAAAAAAGQPIPWAAIGGWALAIFGIGLAIVALVRWDKEWIAILAFAALIAIEVFLGWLPGGWLFWAIAGGIGIAVAVVDWIWDIPRAVRRFRPRRAAPPAPPAP